VSSHENRWTMCPRGLVRARDRSDANEPEVLFASELALEVLE